MEHFHFLICSVGDSDRGFLYDMKKRFSFNNYSKLKIYA